MKQSSVRPLPCGFLGVVLIVGGLWRLMDVEELRAWQEIVASVMGLSPRVLRIAVVLWSAAEVAMGTLCFVAPLRLWAMLGGAVIVLASSLVLGMKTEWGSVDIQRCGCGLTWTFRVLGHTFADALVRNGLLILAAALAVSPSRVSSEPNCVAR